MSSLKIMALLPLLLIVPMYLIHRHPITIAGFDKAVYLKLSKPQRAGMLVVAHMTLLSVILAGISITYGSMLLSFSDSTSMAFGFLCALFCWTVFRLLNAGSGYSLEQDYFSLSRWLPSVMSTLFVCVMGSIIIIPMAILVNAWLFHDSQLAETIFQGWDRLWDETEHGVAVLLICILIFSAFLWLRYGFIYSVRQYEKMKWQQAKKIVDSASKRSQETIEKLLKTRQIAPPTPLPEPNIIWTGNSIHDKDSSYILTDLYGQAAEAAPKTPSETIQTQRTNRKLEKETPKISDAKHPEFIPAKEPVPDFFEQPIKSLLKDKNYHLRLQEMARYLGSTIAHAEAKLLTGDLNETIKAHFQFELNNLYLFRSMAPANLPKLKKDKTAPLSLSCPQCRDRLTPINTSAKKAYLCEKCNGMMLSNKQIESIFGKTATLRDWQRQEFTKAEPSHFICPKAKMPYTRYQLTPAPMETQEEHDKKASEVLYNFESHSYWLPKDQLKDTLSILREKSIIEHSEK